MRLAAVRLGWTAEQCLNATPAELAIQFYGFRQRRNWRLAEKAWEMSWLLAPHVKSEDRDAISQRTILYSAPGFDPDPGDLS